MAKEEDIDAFLSEMAEYVKGKFSGETPPEGAPAPPPKTEPPTTEPPKNDPPKNDPPKNEHGASKRWFG